MDEDLSDGVIFLDLDANVSAGAQRGNIVGKIINRRRILIVFTLYV